ncbi:MAG: HD domain-containing protein [Candidatus Methanomethylicaceae archaeon]
MSFNNIKFEKEYPILKSYILPYRDNDKIVDYRELIDNDIEIYKSILEKLKEFITATFKIVPKELNDIEKLELISDLISLFFRLPLLKEIIPSTTLNPLKIYLYYRLYYKIYVPKDPIEFIEEAYKNLSKFQNTVLFKILSEEELSNNIEKVWFTIPADTRPGFNTSGLIPHLLLTSAISWILAIDKGFNRKDIAILRLASLLHDIGKPFNYKKHVEVSKIIAEILLKDLIPLDEINRIIENHHILEYSDRYVDILREADRIASTIDRIKNLIEKYIGEDIKDYAIKLGLKYENAFGIGKDSWDFWSKIVKEDIEGFKNLCKKFVEKIRKETENFTKPIKVSPEEIREYEKILICICDIASIQSFIKRSQEIRITIAASQVIDNIVMAYIPLYIQLGILSKINVWYPYESYIYTAGGVDEFLLPSNIVHNIENVIKEINEKISKYEASLRFAYSEIYNDMYTMLKNLFRKLSDKKYSVKLESKTIEEYEVRNGSEILCNICYKDKPIRKKETIEGTKELCNICYSLYDLGNNISFKERYESSIILNGKEYNFKKIYGNKDWDDISKYIIEIISGHSEIELDFLERGRIKRRNVAIVKIDGNLMGPFMGTSISFTDVYERSARIDLALKKSIFKALEKIHNGINDLINDDIEAIKQCAAILLGILYAGGDDSLIILPSWLALLFSWIIGNEFRLNLGNARGLGIGIAVGNAKANIWSLISASDELKTEAKKYIRNNPSYTSIMFDIAEETTLTDGIVKSRLRYLENEKLTIQPLILNHNNDALKEYVKLLFNISEYDELLKLSYLLSRYDKKEVLPESLRNNKNLMELLKQKQRYAKDIRSALQEVIQIADKTVKIEFSPKDYVYIKWFVSLLYAYRQSVRLKGKDKENIYKVIINISPKKTIDDFIKGNVTRLDNASYLDADRLIKIIGGGVI